MLTILQTKDYSQFKSFDSNRQIKENKLLESVKNKDMLHAHPIIVKRNPRSDISKYLIIDGQHRHAVAKKLQIPLYYIVTDDLDEEDIPACQVQRPWMLEDFLHFFSSRHPDYEFVEECVKEFNLKCHFIIEVSYHNCQTAFTSFRKGTFRIKKDKSTLKEKFKNFKSLKDLCESFTERTLFKSGAMAIWKVMHTIDYDQEMFMDKIDKYRAEVEQILKYNNLNIVYEKLVNQVYNRNNKDKKKNLTIEMPKIRLRKINRKRINSPDQILLFDI